MDYYNDSFDVWESRDVGSDWGPISSYNRSMLSMIEMGAHDFGGALGWQREA